MKKICTLLINLFFVGVIFAQEKLPNPKIGKNEMEVSAFIFSDDKLVFGGEFVYRVSVKKKLKVGAGVLYGADYAVLALPGIKDIDGYGAAFADIMLFGGHREKWCYGGQIGYGIFNDDKDPYYSSKTLGGIYYSISVNYRAIISKKLLLANSLFIGYRNNVIGYFPSFLGLKAGIVF